MHFSYKGTAFFHLQLSDLKVLHFTVQPSFRLIMVSVDFTLAFTNGLSAGTDSTEMAQWPQEAHHPFARRLSDLQC